MGQEESKNVSYWTGQEASQESHNKLIVAAIDFGTTYSGWAFSFKHEYDTDPTRVYVRQWHGGMSISEKAPSTVLIQPDGETFDSFGYDAEQKYVDLVRGDKLKEWYYFHRFTLMLHEKTKIVRDMMMADETQKFLPAMKVFSLVIRYMRGDILKRVNEHLSRCQIEDDEIMWVLTLPAIWDDAAKQFMREAAIMAGIKNRNVMIALRPEAAFIYCLHLPVDKMLQGGGMSSFKTGSKYMVLDAGGGSIDITVLEVLPGCKLKEIYTAPGGNCGGAGIDEAFKQFLIRLIGSKVFSRFQTEKKGDYLDLLREFELKKRSVYSDSGNKVRLRLPSSLKELFIVENGENMSKAIETTIYADQVSLYGDRLSINYSVVTSFFSETIQNIVSHVQHIMKDRKVKEISGILMVGGFSESRMLQEAIKSNFPNVKVIIPQEAGLVALKGAVVFGHSPSSIAERVCKYTYGTNICVPFDKTVHDASKRVEFADGPCCADVFSKLVEVGQTVKFNETTKERSYIPRKEEQTAFSFDIYASPEKSPKYVTDKGCVKLGTLTMDICDKTVPRDEREFLASTCFGGTEIEVIVKEKRTGKTSKVRVNFLG